MATGYYIRKQSSEWEAVERWENEGGRVGEKHDDVLDSIFDQYLPHLDQVSGISARTRAVGVEI